jgi:D-apiose dehydrogenase
MNRIAFIGLGAAARNIHLPACRLLGNRVAVVAGSDPDAAARTMAMRRWRVPKLFADPAEMLEQVECDWVVVCTPPAVHRDHAQLALAARRHVFCEKPLAESLADARAMMAAAKSAGKQLVVNNQFPFMACHRAALQQIDRPEFGKLLFLHAWHTMQPSTHTEAGWRGALVRRLGFEFGIHVVDLIRAAFRDDPVRLTAQMPRPDPTIGWDPVNLVTLEFSDGRAASIVLDRLSKGPERYLDMRFDGEFATVHTSLGGRLELSIGVHPPTRRPFAKLRAAGGGIASMQRGTRERVLARDGLDLFAAGTARLLGDALAAVDAGREPPAAASANIRSLALVFAAYDSAASGKTVELAPYFEHV